MGDTEQTTTIGETSETENNLVELMAKLAKDSGSQLGDLSDISSGDFMNNLPPELERALRGAVDAQTDIQMRGLNKQFEGEGANLRNQLSAQGIDDSSIELMQRGSLFNSQRDREADVLSDAASKYYQGRIQLPMQVAGLRQQNNAQLLQQLMGQSGQAMQSLQGTRFGNTTTTQSGSPFQAAFGFGNNLASGGFFNSGGGGENG